MSFVGSHELSGAEMDKVLKILTEILLYLGCSIELDLNVNLYVLHSFKSSNSSFLKQCVKLVSYLSNKLNSIDCKSTKVPAFSLDNEISRSDLSQASPNLQKFPRITEFSRWSELLSVLEPESLLIPEICKLSVCYCSFPFYY